MLSKIRGDFADPTGGECFNEIASCLCKQNNRVVVDAIGLFSINVKDINAGGLCECFPNSFFFRIFLSVSALQYNKTACGVY